MFHSTTHSELDKLKIWIEYWLVYEHEIHDLSIILVYLFWWCLDSAFEAANTWHQGPAGSLWDIRTILLQTSSRIFKHCSVMKYDNLCRKDSPIFSILNVIVLGSSEDNANSTYPLFFHWPLISVGNEYLYFFHLKHEYLAFLSTFHQSFKVLTRRFFISYSLGQLVKLSNCAVFLRISSLGMTETTWPFFRLSGSCCCSCSSSMLMRIQVSASWCSVANTRHSKKKQPEIWRQYWEWKGFHRIVSTKLQFVKNLRQNGC